MKNNKPIFLFILFFFSSVPILNLEAASLYYNFQNGVISGDVIEVEVGVENNDTLIGAFESEIFFNPQNLEFMDVKTQDSIIDYWGTSPFLKNDGEIFFNGVSEQGFDGEAGELFTIIFNVLENKGLGIEFSSSNILIKNEDNSYSLQNIEAEKKPLENIFIVSSSTHPEEDSWYSSPNVVLEWTLPSDAKKVRLLIDENESTYPSVEYDDLIYSKEIELDDGVWYFHIRYEGEDGWSDVISRKIMIDSSCPSFNEINIGENGVMTFEAEDDISGIKNFEVSIPVENYSSIVSGKTMNFPFSAPGVYDIFVRAVDNAGNNMEKSCQFKIAFLDTPNLARIMLDNNKLIIVGNAKYDCSSVYVSLVGEENDYGGIASLSKNGNFIYSIEDIEPGVYQLFLMGIGNNGVSEKVEKAIFIVEDPDNTFKESVKGLKVLAIIIIVIAICILLCCLFKVYNCQKPEKAKKRGRPRKVKK